MSPLRVDTSAPQSNTMEGTVAKADCMSGSCVVRSPLHVQHHARMANTRSLILLIASDENASQHGQTSQVCVAVCRRLRAQTLRRRLRLCFAVRTSHRLRTSPSWTRVSASSQMFTAKRRLCSSGKQGAAHVASSKTNRGSPRGASDAQVQAAALLHGSRRR